MFTLEEKINIALSYIATTDKTERKKLQAMAIEAVEEFNANPEPATPQPAAESMVDVEELIIEHLNKAGVPPHLIGFDYIVSAIELCLKDPEYLRNITKGLYADISTKYNTTPSRVERAIRHGVEVAFDRGDWEYLMSAFGNTANAKRGKLTNSEFLAASVNLIRSQIKKLKK